MPAETLPEVDGLDDVLETEVAIHLVFRVALDWEGDRQRAVALMERKALELRRYAQSPAFRERFGDRPAVLRMRTPRPPPSIIATIMADADVEVEVEIRGVPAKEMTCAICARSGFEERQGFVITGRGWACPSCFRGWSKRQAAGGPRPPAEERMTNRWRGRVPLVIFLVAIALLAVGTYWKVREWQEVKRGLFAPSFTKPK